MLDYFAERGWIELQVSGLVHGYRKLMPLTDVESLTQQLYQDSLDREVGELSRLNELYELMASDECQAGVLSAHFGQSIASECGHCSVCEGNGMGELPDPQFPRVGDSALTGVRRLSKQHPEHLSDARQQARFLCGLSSPKMVRARLSRDPLYGCCSAVPFDHVIEALTG